MASETVGNLPPETSQDSVSVVPEVALTWDDFLEGRVLQPDIPVDNGLNLSGFFIPEPVLESILCRLPVNEILKCNLVCRAWKDLLTRRSFWKKCFNYENKNWESVPLQVRKKPGGWMVLHAQLRHSTLSRNFINNPSGHLQFEGWNTTREGGNGWQLEDTPHGCNHLPELNSTELLDTSCWATSYEWCSKYYEIDLCNEGVTPAVMKVCLPVEIKCSQMYSTRFDCGGRFRWKLELMNSHHEVIAVKRKYMELPAEIDWHVAEYSFKFFPRMRDGSVLDKIRFLRFTHTGKDTQWWAGHFGMKFARSSVTLKCLDSDVVEEAEEDGDGYESSDNDGNGRVYYVGNFIHEEEDSDENEDEDDWNEIIMS